MTDSPQKNPLRVRTEPVRLAFVSVFEKKPRARGSDKMSYQATLLIPPTCKQTIADVQEAMKAAMLKKFNKVVPLKERGQPVKKCEDFEYAGYEKGWLAIGTNSDRQPAIVDRQRVPVTNKDLVYSGVWAHVIIDCFAWDHPTGGKGCSFDLRAIQLVKDDERLDGRGKPIDPDSAFEALEMEGGDDESNPFL